MNPLGYGDPLRLGPYRLVGVLGEGGMGKVYLAAGRDGRPAAVKVLRPELAHDQDLARRFVREAHTAAAVDSPGVARVLAAEVEGGRPWIATEFLSGPTLEEAVARYGPLDETAVRLLAAALGETLRDVHAAGLVHRDVKPANIVLTAGGPRLIDFGIARPEHGLTLTTTGQIPVTPGYGAPEQVLGQRVTGAADVFSLGAVLVYAATGRRAYTGSHVAAVQYAVVHERPDLGGLPPALHPLIAPCFQHDPALRPAPARIAAAFAPGGTGGRQAKAVWRQGPLHAEAKAREAEIRRLTAATVVPRAGGDGPAGPSRRRFLAAWGAGGALLLAGGGGTAWWLAGPGEAAPPAAGDAPDAALLEGTSAGILPKPLWGPLEAAASGPLPTPVVLRDVVVFAARDGGLTALRVVDGTAKWTHRQLAARAGQVAVNEDEFACADASGRLSVRNASTGEEAWAVDGAEAALLLAATPEGVYFLTSAGRLRAVDTAGRRIRWTVDSAEDPAGASVPLAAAGGGRLVVSGTNGDLTAVDTADGRTAWRVPGKSSKALQPAIEGDTVYAGGEVLSAFALPDGRRRWEEKGYGDWGPPVPDADGLTVTSGGLAYRYRKDGTRTDLWIVTLVSPYPSMQPPVTQGDWIWVVEGNHTEAGVSALSRSGKDRVWTYERDNPGPWAVAAAGNRVFLLSRGRIVAMPTA
ncbi:MULTISPECIES: PQQ-binding-like beta-propeller repeat protein [unclassified Streptomyces]|uniref:serine/threonine-protein kinase n=1 Tax=unclassified Streptomyces TaxID=2593676 RepID=UPI0004C3782D